MSHAVVPQRQLGKNGPMVPALGFGLMSLSYVAYGTIPTEDEQFKILDRAYELGARNWDTADLYGDGEAMIGKWFQRSGKRHDIFLATKFGLLSGQSFGVNSSAAYCKEACAKSLHDLGVDFIDLYYMHHANRSTPIEETMRALVELQAEGKIKHIGLSAVSANTLRRACKIAHVAAVQVEYSPFVLDIEDDRGTNLLATCRELGVAVVAAMPLSRGLLTTTFAKGDAVGDENDRRTKVMPRFMEENKEANTHVVKDFERLAQKYQCSISQLALAWVMAQGEDIIPIPGTKRMKFLEENWDSLKIHLTEDDNKEIREALEKMNIQGNTLPPGYEDFQFVDTVEEK